MKRRASQLILAIVYGAAGCAAPSGGADRESAATDPPAVASDEASSASAAPPEQVLLARYHLEADPATGSWELLPAPVADDEALPEGIGRSAQALANGDEAVQVTFGTQATLKNCVAGQCGCDAGAFDPPAWYNGSCFVGQRVAYGKVRLSNTTSGSYFQNPAAVFVPRTPPSLRFYSTFPVAPFSCSAYSTLTRSVAPYNGQVYARYNDISAGGCDKGVDTWIAAASNIADANAIVSFDIYVVADSLVPTQVPNGGFETGLANWTLAGSGSALAEHCSHVSDYTCGPLENGVLPPAGSGTMARLLTVDGAATPAYSGALTSATFQFQAGLPKLSFGYKAGSLEAANVCLASNNDEFYVEARKNGGSWVTLPLSNPPDTDSNGRVSTVADCLSFGRIDLAACFENSWYPGSPLTPQAWATASIDLTAAPLGAVAGDLVQVRFWTVSGPPSPQIGASVLLLDDVQMVP